MSASRSDALVLFGVTGDLAYKKIFPALYSLAKRGALNLPIIGVALSNWGPKEADSLISKVSRWQNPQHNSFPDTRVAARTSQVVDTQ